MTALQSNNIISDATIRNWAKLNPKTDEKLISRANKRRSKKKILPLEYFCNLDNIDFVQCLLNMIDNYNWSIQSVVFSLGVNKLKAHNIFHLAHVQLVLNEYNYIPAIEEVINLKLPDDEIDIVGLVYQSYLYEGKKNAIGSYYTPRKIVKNMIQSFDFSDGQTIFDPCCGSGVFLLEANAPAPEQLFGVDIDKIAVMIAKINMLLKYKNNVFYPQIYCLDFLKGNSLLFSNDMFLKRFDYIVTNPPWGAMINDYGNNIANITSKETFSCFFVRAFEQLKKNGVIRFLFPESILNVKIHSDIRSFILNKTRVIGITAYDGMFSGVTTKYVDIECANMEQTATFTFHDNAGSQQIDITFILKMQNLIFNFMSDFDKAIIQHIKCKGTHSLQQSIWGLGIVTGDNKNKLFTEQQDGMEKIYTGKEICPYFLKNAKNYLLYDRSNLQQVAKEEIYRADEKLVYKFVSNKLVFAYDNTKSLFLNSANILIPYIPNMSIKTVMAFLNSELFQFLYIKMFGELKILKGNLIELPFPNISAETENILYSKVDELLKGDISQEAEIQDYVFAIYGLTLEQISYIRRIINGEVN